MTTACLFIVAVLSRRVDVHFVTDEADAVLNILAKRAAHRPVADADWGRLFTSEGYVRLKKRENSMKRPMDESIMREFVMSGDLLERREILARTLRSWRHADLTRAAQRALAYLPPQATIRAKVYPVIKPSKNSFVFEVATDPAIFKYVEDESAGEFERTMSHEMHHIGYGTACHSSVKPQWIGAFGEGFAVLAAAGGPDQPPQGRWTQGWNKEMAKFDDNFRALQAFLLDSAEGRLKADVESERAFSFFGPVGEPGPWYTVGWKMAVVIEKTFGRDALIGAMCDSRTLLSTYNRAADQYEKSTGEKLPRWSQRLVDLVSSPSS